MEAVKGDSVLHESAHAFAEFAHQPAVFTFPEAIRVVDDNAVSLVFDGGIDEAVPERDARDDFRDLVGGFDAKAIDDFGEIGLTDVWRIPQTSNKEREGLGHATPKPIALCARAIHASSREGEAVLDVFGGSGSTLIACEQLNRRCYMVELDPHYCDVIIQRWENLTDKKAELVQKPK